MLGGRGCKIADIADAPEIAEGDVVGLIVRRDQAIEEVRISKNSSSRCWLQVGAGAPACSRVA